MTVVPENTMVTAIHISAPGTGKSEVVVAIQEFCKITGIKFATTATTGVAATRVSGVTAHSFFKLPVNIYRSE